MSEIMLPCRSCRVPPILCLHRKSLHLFQLEIYCPNECCGYGVELEVLPEESSTDGIFEKWNDLMTSEPRIVTPIEFDEGQG